MASSPALGGGKKPPPDITAVAGAIAGAIARANADASARATVDNRVLATGGTGGTAS